MDKRKGKEINLLDYLQYYWKHKFAIIILTIICAVTMLVGTYFLVDEKYTASGVLYISNDSDVGSTSGNISYEDIVNSRYLAHTYIETLTLRSFLTEVSKDVSGDYTWKDIRGLLDISVINETEFISVKVTSTDKQLSYEVASSICERADAKFRETFNGGSATIVDEVIVPEEPDGKGTLRNAILGALAGMAIMIAMLTAKKLLDKKIHRSIEIKQRYDISILGETVRSLDNHKKRNRVPSTDAEMIGRILNKDSDFDTVETYKSIRTNIMLSIPKKTDGSVILLTSASPSEGKTTTSINTAITFAEMGAKTILIDCDLRKPRVHRYMQIQRDNGVSNVICGHSELHDAIKHNIRPHLDVLTAGDISPNPAELLLTEQFDSLMQSLRKEYRYIILDTPPITIITDAAIISKYSDGAIIVAREEQTNHDLFSIAIAELRKANTTIFGAIVHDCIAKRKKYQQTRPDKHGYSDRKSIYQYSDDITPEKRKKIKK